ncbi:MAG: hypothetical protein UV92_C0005G0012 [Parcubacteria group bacterium GW2011_GWA1_43_27]|nr:MAG: hypothetical protein UV69_C0010G0013 [Parcubacteria group bacterium GW2011_GWE2_43_12]KKT14149.1 MAG: hypothetical protein UV92_C0005G0012 [Parcubacteria group bacterium GW2011_GWA1_43_27]HBZ36217.1 hypothetical protein [Candidatus Veblenbacteria bacterium]HCM45256.1 hypothetical protein [Candidatus Veblenbacteria bacterium]
MIKIALNLLSPTQKEYLRYERAYLQIRTVMWLMLTFTVIISGLLLVARLMLQDNYATVLTTTTLVNDKNKSIDRDIGSLNKSLKEVESIQADFIKWSKIIIDINKAIPDNVELSYLNLEQKTRLFNLNGKALKRDDFLALKANLEALLYFEELSSPLTNLLLREDVNFEFTGKIKKESLTF